MSELKNEPATLFDLGVQAQAFGLAISMLLDACDEQGVDVRSAFLAKLTGCIDALDSHPTADWSEGRAAGALRQVLRYTAKSR